MNIFKNGTHKRRSEDGFQITPWVHSLMGAGTIPASDPEFALSSVPDFAHFHLI